MKASNWIRHGTITVAGIALMSCRPAFAAAAALLTVNFLSNATQPDASLVQGTDGSFYGTAAPGLGQAAIFRVTPDGTLTTLYTFSTSTRANGLIPAGLTLGSDGNFYGRTADGGTTNNGTVFRVTPGGVLTTLYSFPAQCSPTGGGVVYLVQTGLAEGADGNFYGTTSTGGANCEGTFYRVTPGGVQTTLYSFGAGADGANPITTLTRGSDGNFYGATAGGGANGVGTLFLITPGGATTTLASFTGLNSPLPSALVEGADGNFYGTTPGGGAANAGTIFRVTPAGTLTVLYAFTGGSADGYGPSALVRGGDGNFYGTTSGGAAGGPCPVLGCSTSPPSSVGSVFSVTPAGVLTTLYSFGGADGQNPQAALVQAADGNFYGTTSYGGLNNAGTIFKLSTGLASSGESVAPPPADVTYSMTGNGVAVNWTAVPGAVSYNIYATTPAAFEANGGMGNRASASATGTSATLTGLASGTTYFKVAWVDAAGHVSGLSKLAVPAAATDRGGAGAMTPNLLLLLGLLVLARAWPAARSLKMQRGVP